MINEPRTRVFGSSLLKASQCCSVGLTIATLGRTSQLLTIPSASSSSNARWWSSNQRRTPRSEGFRTTGSPVTGTLNLLKELPGLIEAIPVLQAKILSAHLVRLDLVRYLPRE